MRTHARLVVVLLFVATVGCSTDFSLFPAIALVPQSSAQTEVYATYLSPFGLAADPTPSPQDKTAEQVYHNIQALKGIPAPQLQQVMALFTGALGVKCGYCHTNPFEKDDKPAKQTARRMIQMVFDLNRGNFGGKGAITCYTCHHGRPKPDTVVVLGTNPWLATEPAAATPGPAMPTVDQILDRYVKAIGGRESLAKLTTRISRGSRIGADGVLVPEEVYQKAPDKLLVITKYPDVALTVRVNGQRGWSGEKDKPNEISGEEMAELAREAVFSKEISLKELYSTMQLAGKASVGEKEAYVIEATSRSGIPEKLYFDTQTGLLVRRYRESKTVLGPFPLQMDFEDYQVADDVKIPLTIRWSMPGRVWGRRIAEVKHNVPIEDEQFNPPRK
jgi:photosynthetic reaction center cytochrome c subunit